MDQIKLIEQLITYDWTTMFYRAPTEVEIAANVNAIFVVNLSGVGGAIITVNEFPVNPALVAGANGETWAIGGNRGEIISRKQLNIGAAPGGGANFLVCVVQKTYTNC